MKVLAISSPGGHWVQLNRLKPFFENKQVVFGCTIQDYSTMVDGDFYCITDFNRNNPFRCLVSIFEIFKLMFKIKPDVVLTTGAAPGLISIIAARFLGIKAIWVDSLANTEKLSLSGRLAIFFANRVYTQWPHLQRKKIYYFGNVLG